MKKEILNIEIRLLIVKYGYKNILEALSKTKGTSIDEIESLIVSLEKKSTMRKATRKKSVMEVAEDVISGAEHYTSLHKLAIKYQSKEFLPQLKDVRRFLERSGLKSNKLKSRLSSTKKVFEFLGGLSKYELESLLTEIPENGESAFSALANEIIGGQPDK